MLKFVVFTLVALLIFLVILIIFPIGAYPLRDRPSIKITVGENGNYSKVDVRRQVEMAAKNYGWKVTEKNGEMHLTKNELLFHGEIIIDCQGEYLLPNVAIIKRSYLHQLVCDMDSGDFVFDICVKAIR